MKVMFLDIDGPLNTYRYTLEKIRLNQGKAFIGMDHWFDPQSLYWLGRILEETGCKIVVSSTWRFGLCYILEMQMMRYELPEERLIDITPSHYQLKLQPETRGSEIKYWLGQHPEVEKYVIIDDDDDMNDLGPNLVQVWEEGINEDTYKRSLELLR